MPLARCARSGEGTPRLCQRSERTSPEHRYPTAEIQPRSPVQTGSGPSSKVSATLPGRGPSTRRLSAERRPCPTCRHTRPPDQLQIVGVVGNGRQTHQPSPETRQQSDHSYLLVGGLGRGRPTGRTGRPFHTRPQPGLLSRSGHRYLSTAQRHYGSEQPSNPRAPSGLSFAEGAAGSAVVGKHRRLPPMQRGLERSCHNGHLFEQTVDVLLGDGHLTLPSARAMSSRAAEPGLHQRAHRRPAFAGAACSISVAVTNHGQMRS